MYEKNVKIGLHNSAPNLTSALDGSVMRECALAKVSLKWQKTKTRQQTTLMMVCKPHSVLVFWLRYNIDVV